MLVSGCIRKCCKNASRSTELSADLTIFPGANHECSCRTEPCGDGSDLAAALLEQASIFCGVALG